MAFKLKTKNRISINSRQTLDAHHNDAMGYFNNEREQLPQIYDEYNNMLSELKILEIESSNYSILNFDLQKKIWDLNDKINEYKNYIKKIENNSEENNYILNTSKLLHSYYKIIENENNENNENTQILNNNENTQILNNNNNENTQILNNNENTQILNNNENNLKKKKYKN